MTTRVKRARLLHCQRAILYITAWISAHETLPIDENQSNGYERKQTRDKRVRLIQIPPLMLRTVSYSTHLLFLPSSCCWCCLVIGFRVVCQLQKAHREKERESLLHTIHSVFVSFHVEKVKVENEIKNLLDSCWMGGGTTQKNKKNPEEEE